MESSGIINGTILWKYHDVNVIIDTVNQQDIFIAHIRKDTVSIVELCVVTQQQLYDVISLISSENARGMRRHFSLIFDVMTHFR